ncbi:histidine phosphatase family protein [Limnobacter sp.]|uniref:histidine phosphatase family protein n=1 Tax=Limnobacter sp. TaxID=2003368 RepID=UPI002FE27BD2
MSTLVLMRHGQASFGAAKYDALTRQGEAQARATGMWMRQHGIKPTALVHGPRQRQIHSAKLVLEGSRIECSATEINSLDEFAEGEEIFAAAERYFGRPMWESINRSSADVLRDYDATCRAWSLDELEIPGCLSIDEFRTEVRQWFGQTTAAAGSGQCVLAVTSAGVIAALVCEVMGLPNNKWHSLLRVVRNASLTDILYSKGRSSLLAFNGVGHLPDALTSSM